MTTQTFTSSGTWVAPNGVTSVKVECWGSGGGGGGTSATAGGGGGGGGGEYAAEATNTVVPGSSYTITIGAVGTAGSSSGGNGGTGGNTSFSGPSATTVTAHGGNGGLGDGNGAPTGGAGGSGSANSTHHNGGAGGSDAGPGGSPDWGGGGGGSSGGTSSTGNTGGTGTGTTGGTGGTAVTGGGPGGNGGTTTSGFAPSTTPGGGGGGASGINPATGAVGAAGQVILTWSAPPPSGSGPLVPPKPFTPMSFRHWQPPTAPYLSGRGKMAVSPMAISATNIPPSGTGAMAVSPMGISASGSVHNLFPASALPILIELLVNGTWTDISEFVYGREDIVITRGRSDETQQANPQTCTMVLNNRDGRFSPSNPAGVFYPYLTRSTQLRVSVNAWSSSLSNYSGYRFWGEISNLTPGWDPTGSDVYVSITASGVLRRKSQGNTSIGSALRRYYTRLTGDTSPYAYWPCEDSTAATEIGSAVSGVSAMTVTGAPTYASDAGFGGSDSIPAVNSSSWHGQTLAASSPPGSGSLTEITAGTYTFRCPPGVTAITGLVCIGGGGGGGAAGATRGGGGGGGGGSAQSASVAVTAGTVYTYVVGAGGQPGTGQGTQGTAGASSHFTGDSVTVTGNGGAGGIGGDTSTGGAGGAAGTGGSTGGSGGTGQASTTATYYDTLYGNAGASGGGASGGQNSASWTAPAGISGNVTIAAQAGGGGGAGGASGAAGHGGGGGGGGGYSTGTSSPSAGSSLTFYAGNGGAGGTAAHGGTGGDSTVSDSSVTASGGSGGSGSGTAGVGGSGSTTSGSSGGAGGSPVAPKFGGGGGGGGGGSNPGTGHPGVDRNPGPGGGDGAGGGWGATSSGNLSSCTTGGTGSSGGGGGGGGAATNTVGKVGGGGGGGYITWNWTVTGQPAGGGGGSSAGTSAAGNTGSNGGVGGTAVTGGGAGGNQGSAGSVPGGGGGGGYPATASSGSVTAPGSGAPGEVSFSWNGGAVSPVAADITRFLLDVAAGGGVDGAVLLRIITYGTVARMDLQYKAGGNLELIGYNGSGTVLFDSGSISFTANGMPMLVDVELTASGSNATWSLSAIAPNGHVAIATASGSVSSVSVGYVSDIYVSPNSDVNFASIGQITVQTYADTLLSMATIVGGYAGETAAARISRLCTEEGLTFELVGSAGDTAQMGPQADDTFSNVLQQCEDVDRGQVYEPRDELGVAYRTRVSMLGQNPTLSLDYSAAELSGNLIPTIDDQYTRNDVIITRQSGSSATSVLSSGAMSTAAPPNGVGPYIYNQTVYCYSDSQLANLATWIMTVGTVSDERYPVVQIDMTRPAVRDLFGTIGGLDVGDYIQIANAPLFLTSQPIGQLVWGMTERINAYKWEIDFNAVPESPYAAGNPPTW